MMYVERRNVDGFYNLCRRKQIFMVMFLMIGSCVQISLGVSDSCRVSPSTVEIVEDCPRSKQKWREAAAKKNCAAIASQCDEPHKVVYHCVLNEYANKTLEVCAYGKFIVLGYCTEYNLDVNRIQQNFRTNCTQFRQNPCPRWYHSHEAYKYQGCYELTKKKTKEPVTNHVGTSLSNTGSVENVSKCASVGRNSTGPAATDTPTKPAIVVFVLTFVLCVAALIAICINIYNRVKKKAAIKHDHDEHDEENSFEKGPSLNNEDIVGDEAKIEKDHEMSKKLFGENVSLRMDVIKIEGDTIETDDETVVLHACTQP